MRGFDTCRRRPDSLWRARIHRWPVTPTTEDLSGNWLATRWSDACLESFESAVARWRQDGVAAHNRRGPPGHEAPACEARRVTPGPVKDRSIQLPKLTTPCRSLEILVGDARTLRACVQQVAQDFTRDALQGAEPDEG